MCTESEMTVFCAKDEMLTPNSDTSHPGLLARWVSERRLTFMNDATAAPRACVPQAVHRLPSQAPDM